MATPHGKETKGYVNGFDLTAFLKTLGVAGEADPADCTTFGNQSKKYVPGLVDAKLKAEGVFDGLDPLAADKVLKDIFGTADSVWSYLPDGEGFGKVAFGAIAIEAAYEVESEVGDIVQLSVEGQSNSGMEAGHVLHALGAEVATGNGTNLDNTALTSNGLHAYLQVTDVTGAAPSLVVKVQHSVDNSVWVDLVTFTAVTADNKAERKTIAAGTTINRHLRARHEFGGTMSATTYSLVAGRK